MPTVKVKMNHIIRLRLHELSGETDSLMQLQTYYNYPVTGFKTWKIVGNRSMGGDTCDHCGPYRDETGRPAQPWGPDG